MNYKQFKSGTDIRGIAAEGVENEHINLTDDVIKTMANGFLVWFTEKYNKKANEITVSVGHDSRISADRIKNDVIEVFVSKGVKVLDCSLSSTPSMFMTTVVKGCDAAVQITASHHPFNRNGLKFFTREGGVSGDDISAILENAQQNKQVENACGSAEKIDFMSEYSKILRDKIIEETGEQKPLEGLKIIVDAGNGAGGFYAYDVLKPLGADISGSQFLEPDGMFPNHIPNPENKQAMEAIRSAVLKNKADLGLIFDTDVDRMSAVLSDGSEVNRDSIIAMISAILAPEYPGSTIITDSVTSDRLTYFLEDVLGLKHLCYMRGYKNVINKQKELNAAGTVAPLAMETSGHGALKDNFFLDDGAFLAVKLVIALAKAAEEGKKLDSLIEKLPPLVEEGEFRFKISGEDFKDYGNKVLEEFKARAKAAGYTMPQSYEGVRLSFKGDDVQGWILLRLSLHDPVMPLNIEGGRKGDLAKLVEIARKLTDGFDRLDRSCLKA